MLVFIARPLELICTRQSEEIADPWFESLFRFVLWRDRKRWSDESVVIR
jgi:hypothetical protein